MKTYTHKQETWNAAKCAAIAKRRTRDGMGTVGGPRGLIANSASSRPEYGQTVRYNGGCTRNGEWFEAESVPLPIVAPGYGFKQALSWGTCLVKL